MNADEKAATLVNYVHSLTDFTIVEAIEGYNHMGATISDAMLQAGVNYRYVVQPRVQRLLEQYPEARTTSGFIRLLTKVGHNNLLDWKDTEKPNRILGVAEFFSSKGIETEADLRQWLQESSNLEKLKQLRGIGNKTADYFKILVGIPTSAVDRHLHGFLSEASIEVNGYDEARRVINKAADLMRINRSHFDHSIWKYKSSRKTKPCAG